MSSFVDNNIKPQVVQRTAATIPQTAQTPYFTVTGRVLVTVLVGQVTTIIENSGAVNMDIWSNPTVGADVALCAVNDIANDAVGTVYSITGEAAAAMTATTSGAVPASARIPAQGIIVTAGSIDIKTSASKTGATKWTLQYIPLDLGSTVVAA